MKRTIIIGDVHGCFSELESLFNVFNFSITNDRVIFLGDLVHKGPKSAEVLNFVYENHFEVIMGNHDDFFLKALQEKVDSYQEFKEIIPRLKMRKEDLIQWYLKCPLFINQKDLLLVHGGLDPFGEVLNKPDREILMNLRFWDSNKNQPIHSNGHDGQKPNWFPWYECLNKDIYENKRIFYGHWAKKEVQFHANGKIIGLDTGCCYGGKLSAYIFEENKLVQVESQQKKQFNY